MSLYLFFELNKKAFYFTVRQRFRVLLGSSLCMIVITKATKSKSKKQFQQEVRTGFFSIASTLGTLPTMDHSEILKICCFDPEARPD